ncbi:MAG: hypothetical protein OEW21_10405 [Betaproteobacteria bacterium]|nr:hypothetical protein [Betaproteobacteria bacterium]
MKKALVALGLCASVSGAHAGPADYVYLPVVEYGEKEIDFKAGTAKHGAGDRERAAALGLGWGATPHWWTELHGKWRRLPDQFTQFDAFEWENKFQLTETGRYAIDFRLITGIEITGQTTDSNESKIGPFIQIESGRMQYNCNILFERTFGAQLPSGAARKTEMRYPWQVEYRHQAAFEFGTQGFGKIDPGNCQKIRYNAAWLLAACNATPDHTLRMQAEYEF